MPWSRIGNIASIVWGAFLLASAVAMVAIGNRLSLRAASLTALFGIALISVSLAQLIRPSKVLRLTLSEIARGSVGGIATAFDQSKLKVWLMIVGGICFVGIGVTFVLTDELIGWIIVAFFGPAVVFLVARGTTAGIALTRQGILLGGPLGAWIPWSSIKTIGRYGLIGQPFLGVSLLEGANVRIGTVARVLQRSNRSWTEHDLSVSLQTLASPPAAVEAIVRFYLEHPEHRAELGQPSSLEMATRLAD